MKLFNRKPVSRLKKKLLLYFILISVVSISVSGEIIFEMSSSRFKNQIKKSFCNEVMGSLPKEKAEKLYKEGIDDSRLFAAIDELRNRMILLLLVISGSIVIALFLFAKDIVSPMDGMVDAAKKIADGDLTIKVPVVSNDEIGQIGDLINTMNEKLLEMIIQVKQDLNRHKDKMRVAAGMLNDLIENSRTDVVLMRKKLRTKDFQLMIKAGKDMINLLEIMTSDLTSLQNFVNTYKTYTLKTELSQSEIEEAIRYYEGDGEIDV